MPSSRSAVEFVLGFTISDYKILEKLDLAAWADRTD